jgi:hypothetical protein
MPFNIVQNGLLRILAARFLPRTFAIEITKMPILYTFYQSLSIFVQLFFDKILTFSLKDDILGRIIELPFKGRMEANSKAPLN